MKELSAEEKAKAYDSVREKIAIRFGSNVAKEIFSEYEEDKDERIRKAIRTLILSVPDIYEKIGFSKSDCFAWIQKQVEQNHTWSEEDEKFFKTALWHISYSISNGKHTDIHCDTTDWLKSLKERVQPQPKQEWSEDDDKMLNDALDMIEWYSGKNEDKSRLVSDWLKSLKDRYTWKPSDEQLNSLKQAINTFPYETDYLELLYDDLMKLKLKNYEI